jgi:hypothetical protein
MPVAPPENPTQDDLKAIAKYILQQSYDDGISDLTLERSSSGFTGKFVDRTDPKKVFEYEITRSGDGWEIGYEPISGVEDDGAEFAECAVTPIWNPAPFDFTEEPSPDKDPADLYTEQAIEKATPIFKDWLSTLESSLFDGAESLEQVRTRVDSAYSDLDAADFAQLMSQLLTCGYLSGRYQVQKETADDTQFAEPENISIQAPELLAAIRRILAKFYTDGIDAIAEAYVDEDDNVQGVFLDYINRSLTKRFAFTITDNDVSYRLLNPDQVERADFSEDDSLDFATPKQCKKGIACGNSCISASKTCHKKTTPAQQQTKKAIVEQAKKTKLEPAKSKTKTKLPATTKKVGTSDFPQTLENLEEVKPLGGSTGAKLVRDPATGKLYVRKSGSSPGHIREESTADKAYAALGVNVPNHQLYETKDGSIKLAEYIEGTPFNKLKGEAKTEAIAQLQKHFAADALLGNWDVIGLANDNVIVGNDGKVYRVDNGGSLRYRAQGTVKPQEQWNHYPTELWSMRDPKTNAQAAKIFKDIKHGELVKQIDAIASQEKEILTALPKDLHPTVQGRIAEMKRIAEVSKTLEADSFKEDYIGEFTKHSLGIRAAGIVDKLPEELKRSGKGVVVVDKKGKKFDDLRGENSIMYDVKKYINSNGGSYEEITTWMNAQAGSSWSNRSQAVKYFLANQRKIDTDSYYWHHGVDVAKNYYEFASNKKFANSFTAWHAFNYEMMRKVKFEKNNPASGTIELIRTENISVMEYNKLKPGDTGVKMKRSVIDSTSVYQATQIHGTEVTVQKVPYHRIIGTYFTERHPGKEKTAFLKDSENEFVAMLDDIPFNYEGYTKKK